MAKGKCTVCGVETDEEWKTLCPRHFAEQAKAKESGRAPTDLEVNDKAQLNNKITMLALLKNANIPYDKMEEEILWAEKMWSQAEALKKVGEERGYL